MDAVHSMFYHVAFFYNDRQQAQNSHGKTCHQHPGGPQITQNRVWQSKQSIEGTLDHAPGPIVTRCLQTLIDKRTLAGVLPDSRETADSIATATRFSSSFGCCNTICAQGAQLAHQYLCSGSTPAIILPVDRAHSCLNTVCS